MSITVPFRVPTAATGERAAKPRRQISPRTKKIVAVAAISLASLSVHVYETATEYSSTREHPPVAPGSVAYGPSHTTDTTLLLAPALRGNIAAQLDALKQQDALETQFEAWGNGVLDAYQEPNSGDQTSPDRVDVAWSGDRKTITLSQHTGADGSITTATFGVTIRNEIDLHDMRSASYRYATGANQYEEIAISVDQNGVYSSARTVIENGMVVTVAQSDEGLPTSIADVTSLEDIWS